MAERKLSRGDRSDLASLRRLAVRWRRDHDREVARLSAAAMRILGIGSSVPEIFQRVDVDAFLEGKMTTNELVALVRREQHRLAAVSPARERPE